MTIFKSLSGIMVTIIFSYNNYPLPRNSKIRPRLHQYILIYKIYYIFICILYAFSILCMKYIRNIIILNDIVLKIS